VASPLTPLLEYRCSRNKALQYWLQK